MLLWVLWMKNIIKTAFAFLLKDNTITFDAKARLLQLPNEDILKQIKTPIDFVKNYKALKQLKYDLVKSFDKNFIKYL